MLSNVFFESHWLETETGKNLKLLELLRPRQGNAVVYCSSINAVEYVHRYLHDHGLESLRHHRKMSLQDRRANLSKFTSSRFGVLVVTGGLPHETESLNVNLVVHFNYPASMTKYLDEISVAGLNGKPSRCALLFLRKDRRAQRGNLEDLKPIMVYAQSAMCRLRLLAKHQSVSTIADNCRQCDNCLRSPKVMPLQREEKLDLDKIFEASL